MSAKSSIADRLKHSLGWLCLAASLLLLSSGVRVVRAEEAETPASREAVVAPADLNDGIERLPRAVTPGAAGPNGVLHLNTRGYNYGPNRPTARPEALRASLDAAKKASRPAVSPAPSAAPDRPRRLDSLK